MLLPGLSMTEAIRTAQRLQDAMTAAGHSINLATSGVDRLVGKLIRFEELDAVPGQKECIAEHDIARIRAGLPCRFCKAAV